MTLEAMDRFNSDEMPDWGSLTSTGLGDPDLSHLSPASEKVLELFYIGADAWGKGAFRSQSTFAMNQAAFDIMKGQPVPVDPVFGQPYRWNPDTRELAAPDTPEFKQLDIKPITVPRP